MTTSEATPNLTRVIVNGVDDGGGASAPINRMLKDDTVGRSWVDEIPGLRARRKALARTLTKEVAVGEGSVWKEYEGGLEEMYERGLIDLEPIGDRVLLRGIMPEDADDGIVQLDYDGRRAMLHEVVTLGPGAPAYLLANGYTEATMLRTGDLVWVLTTVADRLANKNKTVRMITVPAKYIGVRAKIKAP